jgi:transposase InsO family protein
LHLTLKKEATKPPARNFLQQQAKFDQFIECYNQERPHQALNMKYPAELYRTCHERIEDYLSSDIPSTIARSP